MNSQIGVPDAAEVTLTSTTINAILVATIAKPQLPIPAIRVIRLRPFLLQGTLWRRGKGHQGGGCGFCVRPIELAFTYHIPVSCHAKPHEMIQMTSNFSFLISSPSFQPQQCYLFLYTKARALTIATLTLVDTMTCFLLFLTFKLHVRCN
ncbi:uncharacterized protein EV420DRAFT_1144818 [Desarmillaria tabescens]|uniref:Uncharacterized protein n=1 Tax=Armillaria tabescens TaxID=1929756 RepID=A0AA39TY82_ARMTA|nr:uncharacterized protein EV420DRAFT_1144818 [Desarmillaria tabescens]KAK0462915.1 hypothetical protein EV420DRAFT_1144818 [Desarmillaria tabescens]